MNAPRPCSRRWPRPHAFQARRAHPGALAGRFEEHHALLLGVHLAHIDQLDTHIATIDARVDELFGPFAERRDRLTTIPGVGSPPRPSSPRSASTCPCSPPPDTSHPGLGCYANFESAGKHKSGRTTCGKDWDTSPIRRPACQCTNSSATSLTSIVLLGERARDAHHHGPSPTATGEIRERSRGNYVTDFRFNEGCP